MTSGVLNTGVPCRKSVNASVTGMFSLAITSANLPNGQLQRTRVSCVSSAVRPTSRTNCCPGTVPVDVGVAFSGGAKELCKKRVINCSKMSGQVSRVTLIVGCGNAVCSLVGIRRTCTPPFSSTGSPMTLTKCITRSVVSKEAQPTC